MAILITLLASLALQQVQSQPRASKAMDSSPTGVYNSASKPVCVDQVGTGTILSHRVCRTAQEWVEIQRERGLASRSGMPVPAAQVAPVH